MKKVLLSILLIFAKICNSATSIGGLGYMLLSVGQEERYNRSKRAAGVFPDSLLWPSKNVPFVVEDSNPSTTRATLYKVFQHLRSRTCINFTRRSTQKNYIAISSEQGCYSFIGCTNNGKQRLSLGMGCNNFNIILVQLMRALGFYREHNRSDRDNFVQIIYENIKIDSQTQFDILSPNENRLLTEFDYDSVTLFGEKEYSKDGMAKTMISRRGNKLVDVKMKKGLSEGDVAGIKNLYKCK